MTRNTIKTSISIDIDVLEKARKMHINISKACTAGLRQEITDYERYQKSKERALKRKAAKNAA